MPDRHRKQATNKTRAQNNVVDACDIKFRNLERAVVYFQAEINEGYIGVLYIRLRLEPGGQLRFF